MASDVGAEVERIRALLRERLKRIPPGVTNGGARQVSAYMDAAKKAAALVDAKRQPTLLAVQGALRTLESFS